MDYGIPTFSQYEQNHGIISFSTMSGKIPCWLLRKAEAKILKACIQGFDGQTYLDDRGNLHKTNITQYPSDNYDGDDDDDDNDDDDDDDDVVDDSNILSV